MAEAAKIEYLSNPKNAEFRRESYERDKEQGEIMEAKLK